MFVRCTALVASLHRTSQVIDTLLCLLHNGDRDAGFDTVVIHRRPDSRKRGVPVLKLKSQNYNIESTMLVTMSTVKGDNYE